MRFSCFFLALSLTQALPQTFAATPPAPPAGTVGLRLAFEPATLDWNKGDVPIHVINNVVEGLFGVSPEGRVVPIEAADFPARGRDSGTWRIHLKPNLRWSDGKPVRAADYIASWDRLVDPKTGSTYSYLVFDFSGWRALGDLELEVRLKNPKLKRFPAAPLTHWATFPVRSDLIAAHPAGWGTVPAEMAFNGPYKIALYQPDVKLELVPNPEHAQPGKLARIEALIVQDDSTALRLYEGGRLHFMSDLSTLDRATLALRPDYHSMKSPVLVYLGLDANATSAPQLASRSARLALSEAIDRSLFPTLLGGGCTPANQLDPARGETRAFDPEAGHRLGPELDGKKLVLGFFAKGNNQLVVEFAQAQWKTNLGLSAGLQANEIKTYWKKLEQRPYPVFLNSFGPPVWDTRFSYELLRSTNPMNLGRWSNAAYDHALDRGDYKTAARIIAAETPIIPLYFRGYDYLSSPRLKGARLNPMTSLDLREARLQPQVP
ncbi:MAG: peptide ABC transporter substrate-binding protein [Deltaproteobacteria bacterium]|nr:peptide ABC transporter substrate-binding protein [Deltaproteobacteria bacterium]